MLALVDHVEGKHVKDSATREAIISLELGPSERGLVRQGWPEVKPHRGRMRPDELIQLGLGGYGQRALGIAVLVWGRRSLDAVGDADPSADQAVELQGILRLAEHLEARLSSHGGSPTFLGSGLHDLLAELRVVVGTAAVDRFGEPDDLDEEDELVEYAPVSATQEILAARQSADFKPLLLTLLGVAVAVAVLLLTLREGALQVPGAGDISEAPVVAVIPYEHGASVRIETAWFAGPAPEREATARALHTRFMGSLGGAPFQLRLEDAEGQHRCTVDAQGVRWVDPN